MNKTQLADRADAAIMYRLSNARAFPESERREARAWWGVDHRDALEAIRQHNAENAFDLETPYASKEWLAKFDRSNTHPKA